MISEKARAARNQYARQWRAKNKDKVQQANRRYWERCAAKHAVKEGGTNNAAKDENN